MLRAKLCALAIAAGALGLSSAHAATIEDGTADVTLIAGDIQVEGYAPVLSDIDPLIAPEIGTLRITGGVSSGDMFFLTLEDLSATAVLEGETDTYAFNGSDTITFEFDVTADAAGAFDDVFKVEIVLSQVVTDPFDASTFIFDFGSVTAKDQQPMNAVPLPASAALLLGGLGLIAARRRLG